ncbi:hypothetical protein PoB_003870600 [Plakobranchus ocellatus]|uniref:Uncharacterized protein n=1 Tax=Plakobranchus ocellatus TaxID=259542 RepID=A0AAV4AVM7_9GAST|nr:hypothetical protein PoB_003870600 [Plakobranchus ocellatus]
MSRMMRGGETRGGESSETMSSGRNTKDEQDDERRRNKGRDKSEITTGLPQASASIGKMKVLNRPVAIGPARTGFYIIRDKSEITTGLPQASASIGKMKVLDRPVAIELARTGCYIFIDKSETTTSLPQVSKDKKNKGLCDTENHKRIYCWENRVRNIQGMRMMTRAFQSEFVP